MKGIKKQKQRTHKGAAKRFKVTATGKIVHMPQKSRHKLSKLTGSQRRRKRHMKLVKGSMVNKVKKILGMK